MRDAAEAGRGLGAGHRRAARRAARDLPHGLGDPDALADRHGGRPRRVHRPEPVAEPVHREPEHRPAVVMYFHAWKQGLKTTYYLRSRPATRIAKATVRGAASAANCRSPTRQPSGGRGRVSRRGRRRLLAREPRDAARPASERQPSTVTARLLDPGFASRCGRWRTRVLRDVPRRASRTRGRSRRSTSPTDVGDLRSKMTDAERHLVQRLVAFFATGDSIVANNLVLNLYKHINAPEARMYLSRQLYEEALHVQFYLTLLDTYVPDPERARTAPSPRSRTSRRSARRRSSACKWIDSVQDARAARDPRAAPPVPAEPDLLRGLHRGAVLLRRVRLRLLPALARAAARAGGGHQLGVPRRERAHGVRVRGREHRARRGARAVRRASWRAQVSEMLDEAIDCETQFAEDLLGGGVAGLSVRDVRKYLEFCADQRLRDAGPAKRYGARRTRSPSWTCRTCRRSRTSSSAASRPTRSASREK